MPRLLPAILITLFVVSMPAARLAASPQHDPEAVTHYQHGSELAAQGDRTAAIREYEAAARLEPRWLELLNDLGVELYLTGDAKAAVAQYRTALQIDPTQGPVRVNLAFALYDLGQVDEAVAEWRRGLRQGAQVADAYAGLALGLYKQGKIEEALQMYRVAIERDHAYARADHLGSDGAGWSRHAVDDAAGLLRAVRQSAPASRGPTP